MRCVVFFSASGTMANALLAKEAASDYEIPLLITDNPQAMGIRHADTYNKELLVLPISLVDNSSQWCQLLLDRLAHYHFDLIVLAGFMRLLSPEFVNAYHNRIINIHPSLLPDFKGLNTHSRALASGTKEHGFSIHLVTENLDDGPLLAQCRVAVHIDDTPQILRERVQQNERLHYPQVLQWIAQKKLRWNSSGAFMNNTKLDAQGVWI